MGLPTPTLRIRTLAEEFHGLQAAGALAPAADTWLFLDYGGADFVLLDLRWAIRRYLLPNGTPWWGVVTLTPDGATHESAIDGITQEMVLAKQAIQILRRQGAH